MQRIAIIGSSGAGKSTLAQQLGEILHIPVQHLDTYYWSANWKPCEEGPWRELMVQLCSQRAWIIDGNYSQTLELRLQIADTIIFLDRSRLLCLWRVIKRAYHYSGRARAEMNSGCKERLTWAFFHYIWSYPYRRRPKILLRLAQLVDSKQIYILQDDAAIRHFLLREIV